MTDIPARLTEAADYLDYLYEGAKHIPTELFHDRDFRVGLIHTEQSGGMHHSEVAQFFYGGAAEVFLTLGPAALPLLAQLLRSEAEGTSIGRPVNFNAKILADHILKAKAAA